LVQFPFFSGEKPETAQEFGCGVQAVLFPADLQIKSAENNKIAQETKTECPAVLLFLKSEKGKR
jgi:hypothetical protein